MDLCLLIPLLTFCSSVLLTQAAVDAASMWLTRCPPRDLKRGRVRLRSKGRVAKYICNRGYQILGDKYSTCVLGKWDSLVPICIKSGCSPVIVPHGQVLETYKGAFLTVHCNPGYSLVGTQNLFCNGIRWNGTSPLCKELRISAQKWCDFENEDLCGWTQENNGDFDWKRNNFATPSGHVGTGPSSDRTHGPGLQGYYMYLDTSSPRPENETARLFSPIFPAANQSSCFVFWYHMFGPTTGTLNVYLHHVETILIFSQSGNHGDNWLQAVLPLPAMPSSFQIMIEGARGNGSSGDITIDDVKLAQGDECISVSSTSVEDTSRGAEDTDKMSCVNRCSSTVVDSTWCECSSDCWVKLTCCPDYPQECHQGITTVGANATQGPTTQPSQDASSSLEVESITKQTTSSEEIQSTDSSVAVSSLPNIFSISRPVEQTTKPSNPPLSSTIKTGQNINDYSLMTTENAKLKESSTTSAIPTTKTTDSFTSGTTNKPVVLPTKPPVVTESKTAPTTIKQQQNATFRISIKYITSQSSFNITTISPARYIPIKFKTSVKPKFEVVNPRFPFIFRRPTIPTSTDKPTVHTAATKYSRYSFRTTAKPTLSTNLTAEMAKSVNDVLHPVWTNRSFPLPPPLPPLGPAPTALASSTLRTRKTETAAQHHTTIPVTNPVTYKWKSKYITTKVKSATHENVAVHEHQLADHSSSNHIVHLVLMVCGSLFLLLAILATVCVARRRKINRRNNEDDDLDIRFLASDEMLDFTLARPSPERETAR